MSARGTCKTGLVLALAMTVTLLAPALHAGSLSVDVISMFPINVGEFAYADLRQARQFPWFAQLKEQLLPPKFRQFEQFLSAAGMDPNTQVEELTWGLVPTTMSAGETGTAVPTADQIVGVALGQFQPGAVAAYFKNQKSSKVDYRGSTLYAFGGGTGASDLFFLMIDANTAAFGQRSLLEGLLDVRFGAKESVLHNNTMYPLINQGNGKGIVWAVLNPGYTRLAMQQLVPQAAEFQQAAPLLAKIQSLTISVQSSNGIEADFHASCSTSDDANNMAALLQAGIMLGKYQATSQNNTALAQLFEGARVAPNGNVLSVSMNLTNAQVVSLIQSKTFAM